MIEKVGRNDPCPCGSGKKYKSCCMLKQQPKTMSGKRTFTAKLISGGGVKAQEPQKVPSELQVTPPDYTALMERSFGRAIYSEEPPAIVDPSEYLPKNEEKAEENK